MSRTRPKVGRLAACASGEPIHETTHDRLRHHITASGGLDVGRMQVGIQRGESGRDRVVHDLFDARHLVCANQSCLVCRQRQGRRQQGRQLWHVGARQSGTGCRLLRVVVRRGRDQIVHEVVVAHRPGLAELAARRLSECRAHQCRDVGPIRRESTRIGMELVLSARHRRHRELGDDVGVLSEEEVDVCAQVRGRRVSPDR